MDPLPPGPRPPLDAATAALSLARAGARSAILVEGWSDQAAVETLARRRGIDLAAEGIAVLPIGGITNLAKFIQALAPFELRLAGLCDAAEQPYLARTLDRLGLDRQRFFACHADLEDELIRALGPEAVEQVLAREGELRTFGRFQEQPDQRGRDVHAQLRRFMGTRARRKIRYGTLLVEALNLNRVPAPLDAVLAALRR